MTAWTEYSLETLTSKAAYLACFAYELQIKLTDLDYAMTPDEALIFLRQITSFDDSMTHTCETAKAHNLLLKP